MKPDFRSAQSRIFKKLGLGLSYCLSLASVLAISAEAMAQPLPGRIATPLTVDDLVQSQTAQSQTAQSQTIQSQTAQSQTTKLK